MDDDEGKKGKFEGERERMCDWKKKSTKKGRNILRKKREMQLAFALEFGETDRFDKWPDSPNIQICFPNNNGSWLMSTI